MLSQRAAGTLLLATSCSLYAYYTFWVLITVSNICMVFYHELGGH